MIPQDRAEMVIDALILDVQTRKWKAEPMNGVLELIITAPERIADLARAIMERLPQGGTFLDTALLFLPQEQWAQLTPIALAHLQANPNNDAARSVLESASLQCPSAVHPLLETLFFVDAWFTTYYAPYSWRETGAAALPFLRRQLLSAPSAALPNGEQSASEREDVRERAFSALLETRHPTAIALACQYAPALNVSHSSLRTHLHNVDCEREGEALRWLVPFRVRHLQFETGYMETSGYAPPGNFPTWQTPAPNATRYRFGGELPTPCGACGQPLVHLITLDPIPDDLGVTGLPRLTLTVCLSCSASWDENQSFFRHDSGGQPAPYERRSVLQTPEFVSSPIVETQVGLVELSSRWRWQSWGHSNGQENLFRVGGHPTWIQGPEFPACPQCQRTMPFLMQLDSELPLTDGTRLLWGDAGMAYLFWCDECRISALGWQCT